jgi:HSP20 family protein
MIERYDPFRRAMSLRQIMDTLLSEAFVMPRDLQGGAAASAPLNMYEEGDTLVVEAELPGIQPEDVDASIERGMLTIRGESRSEEERKERNYLVREQRRGSFVRSVRLPDTVNADADQAQFEHGMLRLTFPKSEQAKPRRIPISGGGQQTQMTDGHQTAQPHDGAAGAQSESGQPAAAGGMPSR